MGFMDVNHCVQAVGYAYISDEEYENEVNENKSGDKNQNSHSGSGSGDSTKRKGYWIIRNQWSTYWGMNGYAYVAMGENTCGILNDMMQAYT
jgi:C1A family cysteine protease